MALHLLSSGASSASQHVTAARDNGQLGTVFPACKNCLDCARELPAPRVRATRSLSGMGILERNGIYKFKWLIALWTQC